MNNLEIIISKNILYLNGEVTKNSKKVNIVEIVSNSELDLSQKKLTVDLSNVTKIDTVGLAILMQWMRELNKLDLNLFFTNINETINYACRLYGVSDIFA